MFSAQWNSEILSRVLENAVVKIITTLNAIVIVRHCLGIKTRFTEAFYIQQVLSYQYSGGDESHVLLLIWH